MEKMIVMKYYKECSNKNIGNSNHNYKILNLLGLCHLEYLKNNNFLQSIYQAKL